MEIWLINIKYYTISIFSIDTYTYYIFIAIFAVKQSV